MSSTDSTHGGTVSDPAQTVAAGKGKGKGKATDAPHDVSMGEDDDSSDEETGAEDDVCPSPLPTSCPLGRTANAFHSQSKEERKPLHYPTNTPQHIANTGATTAEEEDQDNMEEIDTDNIISDGRRTRGKSIDFAKAAEEAGDELDDDDDEEDDDFEEEDNDHEMKD